MTRRRRAALVTGLLVLGLAREVHADDAPPAALAPVEIDLSKPLHFRLSPTITSAGGRILVPPPGYYIADADFARLDAELRRAQDAETRLSAENLSLRASARESGGLRPVLVIAGLAFAAGMGVGLYASL